MAYLKRSPLKQEGFYSGRLAQYNQAMDSAQTTAQNEMMGQNPGDFGGNSNGISGIDDQLALRQEAQGKNNFSQQSSQIGAGLFPGINPEHQTLTSISPLNNKSTGRYPKTHGEMGKKELRDHGMVSHPAKKPDLNKNESKNKIKKI